MITTKYRWFRIERDGELRIPLETYAVKQERYKYLDDGYDSELDALNALEDYYSHQICTSPEFTLIKTYRVDCKF